MRLPAEQRRRELFEAACDLCAERGLHATSMEDIARAAGVTKPVLYQHFSSKRGLYRDLLEDVGARLSAELTRRVGTPWASRRTRGRSSDSMHASRPNACSTCYARRAIGTPISDALGSRWIPSPAKWRARDRAHEPEQLAGVCSLDLERVERDARTRIGGGVDVTVVIPTRDRPTLLRRTLSSVLAQRDVRMQVLVVDDGSHPPANEVVERIADPRVCVIRHDEPRGLAAARNTGIDDATAPWIAFIDDDDVWAPHKLRAQLDALDACVGARWSCVGAVAVDDELEITGPAQLPPPSGDVLDLLLSRNLVPGGGSGVLADAELVRELGAFDITLVAMEDWDFWIRLARQSPVASVLHPLVAYRVSAGSMAHDSARMEQALETLERRWAPLRDERGPDLARSSWLKYLGAAQLRSGHRWRAARTHARLARVTRSRRAWELAAGGLAWPRLQSRRDARQADAMSPEWQAEAEAWLGPVRARLADPPQAAEPRTDDRDPPRPPGEGGRLRGVEGLRAVAALAVLVFHCWLYAAPDGRPAAVGELGARGLNHLELGVVLFFVLSGFLLFRPFAAALLEGRHRPSIRRYLRRRAFRILPAYWAILLVCGLVFGAALARRADGVLVLASLRARPGLIAGNLALLQGITPSTLLTGIGPAWSLAVEVAFYLVLPLLVVGAASLSVRRASEARRWLAASLPAVVLLVVGWSGRVVASKLVRPQGRVPGWDADWHSVIVRSLWANADLFVPGMVLALVWIQVERGAWSLPRWWRLAPIALGAFAIMTVLWVFAPEHARAGSLRAAAYEPAASLAAAALLALVVLPGAPPATRRRDPALVRALEWRPAVAVGLASYSVFLWNEPVIRWMSARGWTVGGGAGFMVNLVVVGTISGVLAAASYHLVERPALRFARKTGDRRETTGSARRPSTAAG